MAGDIALNPRPVSFLCQVCSRPVTRVQRGLECDTFRQWTHAKCASVDIQQYCDLQLRKIFIGAVRLACCLNFRSLVVRVMWNLLMMMLSTFQQKIVIICALFLMYVLCEPCSQLRIVHHNVQGLQESGMILVTGWLAVLRQAVFLALVRPGSSLSQCCCTCLGSRHFTRLFFCALAVKRSTSRVHVCLSLIF